jgi:hypothetical protein
LSRGGILGPLIINFVFPVFRGTPIALVVGVPGGVVRLMPFQGDRDHYRFFQQQTFSGSQGQKSVNAYLGLCETLPELIIYTAKTT